MRKKQKGAQREDRSTLGTRGKPSKWSEAELDQGDVERMMGKKKKRKRRGKGDVALAIQEIKAGGLGEPERA